MLLGGIGILRGALSGRIIGIVFSLLLGAGSLAWGLAEVWGGENVILGLILGVVFVLCAYSAIVLMFRWRRPATA